MIKFIEAINTITNKKNKKRGFPSSLFSCSVTDLCLEKVSFKAYKLSIFDRIIY